MEWKVQKKLVSWHSIFNYSNFMASFFLFVFLAARISARLRLDEEPKLNWLLGAVREHLRLPPHPLFILLNPLLLLWNPLLLLWSPLLLLNPLLLLWNPLLNPLLLLWNPLLNLNPLLLLWNPLLNPLLLCLQ